MNKHTMYVVLTFSLLIILISVASVSAADSNATDEVISESQESSVDITQIPSEVENDIIQEEKLENNGNMEVKKSIENEISEKSIKDNTKTSSNRNDTKIFLSNNKLSIDNGDSIEFDATVYDVSAGYYLTKNVTCFINNYTFEKSSLNWNDITVTINQEYYEIGNNTFKIVFYGDEKHNPSMAETTFEVYPYSRQESIISVDYYDEFDGTYTVGETDYVNGTLYGGPYYTELEGQEVILQVDYQTFTAITDKNGKFSIPIILNEIGYDYGINSFLLNISYYGNEQYSSQVFKHVVYFVTKKVSRITAEYDPWYTLDYKEHLKVGGNLTDKSGNPLSDTTMVLTIDNDEQLPITVNQDGSFNIDIAPLELGSHGIQIRYAGNEIYAPAVISKNFNVIIKKDAILTINERDGRNTEKDIVISGSLTDLEGNPLSKQYVGVYIDDTMYDYTRTDENGTFIADISARFDPGIHNCTVVYDYNSTYHIVNITKSIEVYPEYIYDTGIEIITKPADKYSNEVSATISVKYGRYSDDKFINYGSVENTSLTLNVNGKIYNVTTTSYEDYKIIFNDTSVGTVNNVSVFYNPTDKYSRYKPSSNSTSFNAVKENVTLYMYPRSTADMGSTIKISGKLLLPNGTGIKGETVEIWVMTPEYDYLNFNVVTGGYGYFTTNYKINDYGEYYVHFTYEGSDRYNSVGIDSTFSVIDPVELYMYKIYNTNIGKTIKVSGKLLSNGVAVMGEEVRINVNGWAYSVVSDSNGYFTVNYTVDSYDVGNVTFDYLGSDRYLPCTNTTTFIVKKPVELYMYTIYNTNIGKTIKVSGKMLVEGKAVKGQNINITVNDKKYTATSDKNGYFTVNYTVDSYNNGSVKFRFPGNSIYESCTNTTKFVVKQPVELYMYKIYNTNKDKTIKVSGKVLSNTKPVKGLTVNITVNNKKYAATSDKNGYFTVNYTVDSYNNGSVKFRFPGNSMYESCTNTTTFVVKQPVSIYMYPRTIETYGKTIKVSGKLLCNDTGVKGQTVKITVNGKEYNATTVGYGYFTINYTINSYDDHKVVYKYAGSSLYESCTNTTTFTIKPLNPLSTKITLEKVLTTQYTDTVRITGKLMDNNSKVLSNTNLKLTVNSKDYTIKTDAKGTFTYNYKTNTIGNNNITVSFIGNSSYLESNAKTTFNVISKQTKIIINSITKSGDEYITVTGKYTDLSGTNLTYTTLTVVADGKKGTVKTDGNGIFEYKFKPTTTNNKIDVSYQGNPRYAGTNQSTVFYENNTSITYSKSTIMSIDNIDDVKKSNTVKITGKYVDKDGTKLTYTPIKININGNEYETKTDGNGVFVYNYKTDAVGVHNVSASYHGNARYSGTIAKTTFNVA